MREWWKEAIGYEIYLQSFYDTNGDGIGDLRGVIEKLDYLEELGVTLLWITPFYDSLMEDGGYDVRDHKKIASCYGNIDDFKMLLEQAHKRGMRVIIDLIMNHTSTSHTWFKQALKGNKTKKDYYIIRKEKEEGKLPNNWGSFFYESVWSPFNEDEYYMHIFSKNMADLNWENAKVREEMYAIAKYWLEIGVDGFRLDALAHLAKEPLFIDSDVHTEEKIVQDYSKFSNLPPVISYLSEFKRKVLQNYDCMTIAEVGGNISAKKALHYVNYVNGSLNMMFNFEANGVHNGYGEEYEEVLCDVVRLKKVFETWIYTYGDMAWYPIYLTNHDQTRVLSQYGNSKKRKESAQMLCALQFFMGGTPFIYYGDEIGMSNANYTSLEEYKDIKAFNFIKKNKEHMTEEEILSYLQVFSRVNARSPMQWDASENAGFSNHKPHLKVSENYVEVNVEKQSKEEDSILSFYRKVISLRQKKYLDTVLEGSLFFIDKENKDVFAYKKCGKQKLMVIANFRNKEVVFSHQEEMIKVVLQNYTNIITQYDKVLLRPYEVIVAEIK